MNTCKYCGMLIQAGNWCGYLTCLSKANPQGLGKGFGPMQLEYPPTMRDLGIKLDTIETLLRELLSNISNRSS